MQQKLQYNRDHQAENPAPCGASTHRFDYHIQGLRILFDYSWGKLYKHAGPIINQDR